MAKRDTIATPNTVATLAQTLLAAPPPSAAAIRQAKLLLLDTIGCALAGSRNAVARATFDVSGKSGDCPVIGRASKASMADAVLINGTAARVLDLNDYLVNIVKGAPETGGHPSDNIVVALAVASARGRSGGDTLAAIVLGYELYARLQRLMDRSGVWDGVTVSGLVAPAMAGLLMRLDETRLAHAVALGAAHAATPSIVRRGHLSAAKSLANASVAQAGVQAALLAERGVTGPLAILDDAYGLAALFANDDPTTLTEAFPIDGAILRAHVKAFPCVNTAQAAAAAALALRGILAQDTGSIAAIDVALADSPVIARQLADPARNNPDSREAADHSLPFIVAVALIDGVFGLAQFENERWRDPAVTTLMERITLRTARFPDQERLAPFSCALSARLSDGSSHNTGVIEPPGASKTGLDERLVLAKFSALAEPVCGRNAAARIVDAVFEFDHNPSTASLDAAIAIEETRI